MDGARLSGTRGLPGAESWQLFNSAGVAAIYGPGRRLAAVAVGPLHGPQVWLYDVQLTFRLPSQVRSDLERLATREGVPIRTNWSGDPEVAAWGLSMGAKQHFASIGGGRLQRRDTMCTTALFVCSELADDPYQTAPVIAWRDVREKRPRTGTWPVKPDAERPHWDWTPMTSVGPLRFGMDPQQVAAALNGEEPAFRHGHFPLSVYQAAGQWSLLEDHFDVAGVTAHYWSRYGRPTLGAVTALGRTGPQLSYAGVQLIGRPVSVLDAFMVQHAKTTNRGLRYAPDGAPGLEDLNMYVRATRAGDKVISEARFCTEGWRYEG